METVSITSSKELFQNYKILLSFSTIIYQAYYAFLYTQLCFFCVLGTYNSIHRLYKFNNPTELKDLRPVSILEKVIAHQIQ